MSLQDRALVDDTLEDDPVFAPRWESAQDRREYMYRFASGRTEDLEQRITASRSGSEFVSRIRCI